MTERWYMSAWLDNKFISDKCGNGFSHLPLVPNVCWPMKAFNNASNNSLYPPKFPALTIRLCSDICVHYIFQCDIIDKVKWKICAKQYDKSIIKVHTIFSAQHNPLLKFYFIPIKGLFPERLLDLISIWSNLRIRD